MSSAVLRISVATLGSVPDGQSRIDGVPNQLVTLTSVGTGSTHLIRFFDVTNPFVGSPTAPVVPTISPVGDGRTFTFTPPGGASAWGQSFGIELIVDHGLPTEVRSRRKYAIPTLNQQLVMPLFAEGADPQASLNNNGTAQVANSCDNAGGNWRGYHPRLLRFLSAFELGTGQIYVSPYPQSVPSGLASTIPAHVGTIFLEPGTLYSIGGDIGDAANPAEPTILTLKLQSNPAITLATQTFTHLKSWEMRSVNAAVAAAAAYEIFLQSQNSTGSWQSKGLQFSEKVTT